MIATKIGNLKGDKGDPGVSAGFGTPIATIDSSSGNPQVSVSASGSNTAKIFKFGFSGLKGEKGDRGASIHSANFDVQSNTSFAVSALTPGDPQVGDLIVDSNGDLYVVEAFDGKNVTPSEALKDLSGISVNLKGPKGEKGDPADPAKDYILPPASLTQIGGVKSWKYDTNVGHTEEIPTIDSGKAVTVEVWNVLASRYNAFLEEWHTTLDKMEAAGLFTRPTA